MEAAADPAAEVVGGLRVDGDVDALHLMLGGNPEANGLLDDPTHDEGNHERVEQDREGADGLLASWAKPPP